MLPYKESLPFGLRAELVAIYSRSISFLAAHNSSSLQHLYTPYASNLLHPQLFGRLFDSIVPAETSMSASTVKSTSPSTSPTMSAQTTPASRTNPPAEHAAEPSPIQEISHEMALATLATPPLTPAKPSLQHDVPQEASSATSPSDAQAAAVDILPARETKPFDFLGLPLELREMVYKAVDLTTHRYVLPDHDPNGIARWKASKDVDKSIIMARPVFSFDLLSTCKQINAEARSIFETKLQELPHQPVQFHLGWGAASIITPQPPSESEDSPLVHCLNVAKSRYHKPSDSEEMTAFVARSSTFIQYCQAVLGKANVQLIVDTPDHFSGVHHSNEMAKTVGGAWNLGNGSYLPQNTELDITVIYYKQFPNCRWKEEDPMDSEFLDGKCLEHTWHQIYGTSPNFRMRRVEDEDEWAEIMKGKE